MKVKETPEQMLARWMADPNRVFLSYSELIKKGWEPGQVAYHEIYGLRYEKFYIDGTEFCVVEWDEHGNICVV